MDKDDLKKIYWAKPFKIKNADEYDSDSILDLFIDSTDEMNDLFDYSNSIIKGKSGSGKTMFLRAIYQYFLCILAPALMSEERIIVPIYIRMSDFQNMKDPEQIYYAAIVKIVEEIVSVRKYIESKEALSTLYIGARHLEIDRIVDLEHKKILEKLKQSTAEEYTSSVTRSNEIQGKIRAAFLETYADYNEKVVTEIKRSDRPDIGLIDEAYKALLKPYKGKILILFDEIGALNKSFFASSLDSRSYFEILINQLLRKEYVRTKIAVCPHSFTDVLRGSRFGDVVELGLSVTDNRDQYILFMEKASLLIEKYIKHACDINCKAEDIFKITTDDQLVIEQLVNASNGNMRRLVHIIDSSMSQAYRKNKGEDRVTVEDVLEVLKKQGKEMEKQFEGSEERVILENLARNRRFTNKFTLPKDYAISEKYMNTSEEYNIIQILELGSSYTNTVYCFDYAYCVYREIPTHFIKGTKKIDPTRSGLKGEPITQVEQILSIEPDGNELEEKIFSEADYEKSASVKSAFEIARYNKQKFILEPNKFDGEIKPTSD